jgi:1-acyl-sn-glycerol-3-phosphate acyltransferase
VQYGFQLVNIACKLSHGWSEFEAPRNAEMSTRRGEWHPKSNCKRISQNVLRHALALRLRSQHRIGAPTCTKNIATIDIRGRRVVKNIIIDKPYVFVPPYKGQLWPRFLQQFSRRRLQRAFGIQQVDCRGLENLQASRAEGHGILLTPNHCRPCDPFVISEVARQAGETPYTLASWHLFMQGRFSAWMLRRAGVFSIYREGMDRAALNAAAEILTEAKRPLVIFPEGVISRSNDRLNSLMEGTALVARSAAKKRANAKSSAQVVILPVALRYTFLGSIEKALSPALDEIESRLSWRAQRTLPLPERITKVGEALLGLKEMEFLGAPQSGELFQRVDRLINFLLQPLEKEWGQGRSDGTVVGRVKRLRTAILPDMVSGDISESERDRRWRQLADVYLAQQLWCYPPDYIRSHPHPDRMLETVERFEENLTDECRVYSPMKVTAQIGSAIPVSPIRERGDAGDPVMIELETQLNAMLLNSSVEVDPKNWAP